MTYTVRASVKAGYTIDYKVQAVSKSAAMNLANQFAKQEIPDKYKLKVLPHKPETVAEALVGLMQTHFDVRV